MSRELWAKDGLFSYLPNHAPTHPGAMLLEEFLIPKGLTQRGLADSIFGLPDQTLSLRHDSGSSAEPCVGCWRSVR